MNQQNKKAGLLEIAQLFGQKKSWAILGLIAVLGVIGAIYWHHQDTKQDIKPIEETYTVPTDAQVDAKKPMQAAPQQISVAQTASLPAPPPVNEEALQRQMAVIEEKQKALQQRLSAPLMLINNSQANSANANSQVPQTQSRDANTQFMNQVSAQDPETSMATHIGPLNAVIAEGGFIHATMEPATDADLPGFLRAIVSGPVYSEDGTRTLIPPASRLIGQYKSGMLQGQSRIFIVWTRLITPEGISIQLGSPGVDSLGVAGMNADEINRHFWERFGNASLLSLIGAGAANVGVDGQDQNNSAANYREAIASSFAQTANQSLQQDNRTAPTLKTYQGKPIMVFVAKDLNFQTAMIQSKPKLNVF